MEGLIPGKNRIPLLLCPSTSTMGRCAPASTVSSRASVPSWSFSAFSPRPSAPRAAPSLPASRRTRINNRGPAATISPLIATVPALSQALLPSPACPRIHSSPLSPRSNSVCFPRVPLPTLHCSLQFRILCPSREPRSQSHSVPLIEVPLPASPVPSCQILLSASDSLSQTVLSPI